ncbi:MAG: hypothetical protein IJ222_02645 [Bacteroidales bacterium]|nr:hypothetical protein [Bacteroidales bacterium]
MKKLIAPLLALLVGAACTNNVKYADSFGFLPGNDADSNSEAFQRCLDGGGKIVVRTPGTYKLSKTIFLDSDTDLSFGEGVILQREKSADGSFARFVFLNRGALERVYDENISIDGLTLHCNGLNEGSDIPRIVGMNGQLDFFYVKNLMLSNLRIPDLPVHYFAVHISNFENVDIHDVDIRGMKDALHFGPGTDFSVRNGVFKTYDDPIALNAHDYTGSNPELGWIENGVIDNCYDLDDPEHGTTGFFARILAGGWCDWREGMDIQSTGDAVVSGGRIYRSNGPDEKKSYTSKYRPAHESGTLTYPDGITWTMSQDRNVCHSCGVRNVVFSNIHLCKKRHLAFCFHYDHDQYSRSYYPYAEIPVQGNVTFDKIFIENDIPVLVQARTAVDEFTISNSDIADSKLFIAPAIDAPGMQYDTTVVRLVNVKCSDPSAILIPTERPARVIFE